MQSSGKEIELVKLDFDRAARTGIPEAVYAPGKTPDQLVSILSEFIKKRISVLATKCTPVQAAFVRGKGLPVEFDPVSGILSMDLGEPHAFEYRGKIAVCTGGTADVPVAEEAAKCLEFFGAEVARYYDVGVAGLHRLLSKIDAIRTADIVIAVAGMEGALASVIAGLVSAPVIAVPTSVGYGASFSGLAPLLTMLNSCAEGVSVVNIDNGYGAGVLACRMLRLNGNRTEK